MNTDRHNTLVTHNTDIQLEQDLARLGRSMTPDRDFANRVMEKIDAAQPSHFRRWRLPIGLSMAASFMLLFGWFAVMRHTGSPGATANPPDDQLVRTSTEWQTVSERAIMLEGDVPAREISQQKFERVKWVDPHLHTTFERVLPREKCTFVTLENY
jgi:hypothetical protein